MNRYNWNKISDWAMVTYLKYILYLNCIPSTNDHFAQKMIFKHKFFNLLTSAFQVPTHIPTTIDDEQYVRICVFKYIEQPTLTYSLTANINTIWIVFTCFSISKIFRRRMSFCIVMWIGNGRRMLLRRRLSASIDDVIKSTI